jgi:hypothetical protein
MSEAIFFVVERRAGREEPAIYHDRLPERLTRKTKGEVSPIVYALRLDKLPDLDLTKWLAVPLKLLYRNYCALRDAGKLPPSNLADPPREKGEQGVKRGEYWTPPKRGWTDRPADPFPQPGELVLRPDAGAFIGPEQAYSIEPSPIATGLPNLPSGDAIEHAAATPDPRPSPSEEDDGRGVFLKLGTP